MHEPIALDVGINNNLSAVDQVSVMLKFPVGAVSSMTMNCPPVYSQDMFRTTVMATNYPWSAKDSSSSSSKVK